MKKIITKPYPQLNVIFEILKNKTLTRSLFNSSIRDYEIHGSVLDLGAKSKHSGYYSRIKNKSKEIVLTDLVPGPEIVQVNVENDFPFQKNRFDFVISAHLFEHVFDFKRSAKEIERVLKPDGKFILCLPFHYHWHPDPNDYFRFTLEGIISTWSDQTSLEVEQVEYIGPGIFTNQLSPILDLIKSRLLRLLISIPVYIIISTLDLILFWVQKTRKSKNLFIKSYAIEHIVIFKKC